MVFAQGSDFAKEQRWKEQVVGELFDGEPISLNDGKHDFLGLLIESDQARPEAILILHGVGVHPDWPQVINPLRVQLAEAGWTTLSIQLPVLDNEAAPTAYDQIVGLASPRISAGLVYLQQQGFKGSYIVAHSMGSRMASHFLADTEMSVSGFVGIGMNIGTVEYLNKFSLPMLDIYGSNDLEGVLSSAPDRARQSASNAHYTQLIVDGADHFFNGMDDELVDEVVKWINSH
jgi:dienelactone hydrolase